MEKTYHLGYYFKIIAQSLENTKNKDLLAFDLTSQQFSILMYLSDNRNCEKNAKDLEERFHSTKATISGILKRLEMKGFIERTNSDKNYRYKKIVITKKSEEFYSFMLDRINSIEDNLLKSFSLEEREIFVKALKQIATEVSEVSNV